MLMIKIKRYQCIQRNFVPFRITVFIFSEVNKSTIYLHVKSEVTNLVRIRLSLKTLKKNF